MHIDADSLGDFSLKRYSSNSCKLEFEHRNSSRFSIGMIG
jgi:hypothetical protein